MCGLFVRQMRSRIGEQIIHYVFDYFFIRRWELILVEQGGIDPNRLVASEGGKLAGCERAQKRMQANFDVRIIVVDRRQSDERLDFDVQLLSEARATNPA